MVVRRKKSTGAAKKPSKRVVKLARKYKVKITIKRGSKRVYKTTKLILQQIRRKKKSTTRKVRKTNKFGDTFLGYLLGGNNRVIAAARQQSQSPVPYYRQKRVGRPEMRPPITNSISSMPASGRPPPVVIDDIKLQLQSDTNKISKKNRKLISNYAKEYADMMTNTLKEYQKRKIEIDKKYGTLGATMEYHVQKLKDEINQLRINTIDDIRKQSILIF